MYLLFLLIIMFQLLFIGLFVIYVVSWSGDTTTQVLEVASTLQSLASCIFSAIAFLVTTLIMRCTLYLRPRLLLCFSLLLHTISSTWVICCLSSILVCSTNEVFSDACLSTSPSTIRGQNAAYISVSLLVLSFFLIHFANHIISDIQATSNRVIDTIARNSMLIIFISCGSVCIIDDVVWDWKYAFAFLFTLGITTYINTISTFVFYSNESSSIDAWQLVALVYLQPFLFIEDSMKICLTM